MDEHHAETDGNREQRDLNSKIFQNITITHTGQNAAKTIQIKKKSNMLQIAKATTPKPPEKQ